MAKYRALSWRRELRAWGNEGKAGVRMSQPCVSWFELLGAQRFGNTGSGSDFCSTCGQLRRRGNPMCFGRADGAIRWEAG